MKRSTFFASLVATLALFTVAGPARAAFITYNVTVSGGSYSTNSSRQDSSGTTVLGEPEPAITGTLGLTGGFTVDTTQGVQPAPIFFFPFVSSSGSFINSTVTADQPTPGLVASVTGTNEARLTSYGSRFELVVVDFNRQEFFDNDGHLTRMIDDSFLQFLTFDNVSEFTFYDGKAFPRLNGPGITAYLASTHSRSDYDFSGPSGLVLTQYQWLADGTGTLGVNATATDGSAADVPEPAALALFGAGVAGAVLARRRRAKA